MADLGVFFEVGSGLEQGALVLDVIESIQHESSGEATENPVGAQLQPTSDHFIDKPDMLTILARVFDRRAGLPHEPGRAYGIWRALKAAKRSGRRLGFVSGLEVYQEGLITSVSGPEDLQNEDTATLTITYKVVRVASSATSEIPAAAVATKKGRKRGGQPTKTASAAKADEGSIIYDAFFRE
jgi:hypothetical protein